MSTTPTLAYEQLVGATWAAAQEKAVNLSGPALLVWDYFGFCRAYSTKDANLHLSVPSLTSQARNYSRPIHL